MVYLRLLERIAFKKLTIAEISGKIGIDERSLRKKLIGLLPLYLDEARLISNVLDINSSDEMLYFFLLPSQKWDKVKNNVEKCRKREG